MTRRLFNAAQKKHLYVVADGRCERCGELLGKDWEAHHAKRYADNGVTELPNGIALCYACHRDIHRRYTMLKARGWQEEALGKFKTHEEKCFLLEATPGAGKTIFSGLCAKSLIDAGEIDFALIVVPTTALKGDGNAGFLGDWYKCGVEITAVINDGQPAPRAYRGGVVTYQQLPNLVTTIQTWKRNGMRLFVVFDEVHHASEQNRWGQAATMVWHESVRVLSMTGTPFRGDGQKISFVDYTPEGLAKPDFRVTYKQAVANKWCRPVVFMTDDGVASYVLNDSHREVIVSEAKQEEVSYAAGALFKKDSEFLEAVIQKADSKLDEYRIYDRRAAGLIVCRPGNDDEDDRHLHSVARLVARITNEQPEIITHDDPEANLKIERFRNGSARWLCSVRKVSEGVDIKRLRVEVLATVPSTELLFRQLVGRVVRVEDPNRIGDATVFMAKFPHLVEMASRISEEAQAGLAEREAADAAAEKRERNKSSNYSAIGASHEDGGAINEWGESFSPIEVMQAERLKMKSQSLSDVSVAKVAEVLRLAGVAPSREETFGEPVYKQKVKGRAEISRLVRRVAIKRNNDSPDFQAVWVELNRQIGVKSIDDLMNNRSIETMHQAIALLKKWLGGSGNEH